MKFLASSVLAGEGVSLRGFSKSGSLVRIMRGSVVLLCALALAGCAGSGSRSTSLSESSRYNAKQGVSSSPRVITKRRRVPKGGGSYKLGKPYKIAGKWYVPKHQPNYDRKGIASWYGDDFQGRKTANGEIYDMNALTAAHPTLPLPSYAYVTNLSNGRTVLVRVNDRGPYARGRVIDMSRAAARALNYRGKGLAKVRVRYAGRAPLDGSDRKERRYLARQSWAKPGAQPRASKPRRVASRQRARPAAAGGRVPTWEWRPGRAQTRAARRPSGYATEASALGAYSRHSGRSFIQAGVFVDGSNAQRLKARLQRLAPVRIDEVNVGWRKGYRVTVGPVADGQEQWLLQQVWRSGARGARLVRR